MRKLYPVIIAILLAALFGFSQTVYAEPEAGAEKEKSGRTVMLYLCGADLETRSGMATFNLKQILSSDFGEETKFIILTGGSTEWHLESEKLVISPELLPEGEKADRISGSYNQIWEAKSTDAGENPGKMVLLDGDGITASVPVKSEKEVMSDPATLKTFIDYCVDEYPAEKYDLILWDHGGGPVGGFAVDEHESDSDENGGPMPISKIADALKNNKVTDADGDGTPDGKFDFVDFDACLMGSLELNLILADYTDYYIASPESEPGYGQEYSGWLGKLGDDPDVSTAELGRKIVDDFYEFYTSGAGKGQDGTLAVVDTAKLLQSGFAEALSELNSLLKSQAGNNLFYDELKSVSAAITYTEGTFRDLGNLASMISIVQSEVTDEELAGGDIPIDNAYKEVGMELCSILQNPEIIYAKGTKGIRSEEHLYREPDGTIRSGRLSTSGMYVTFPAVGGYYDLNEFIGYYLEMDEAIKGMPDKEDGRYDFFRSYLQTMVDYALLCETGSTVDSMVNGYGTDKSAITYSSMKKMLVRNEEWDDYIKRLLDMRTGGEAAADEWLDSLIRQQADEAILIKNISVNKLRQKDGVGYQVHVSDAKKRSIASIKREMVLDMPNLKYYIEHNFDDVDAPMLETGAAFSVGAIEGEPDYTSLFLKEATQEDWIRWFNGRESTWILHAPEKKWYAVKDTDGVPHVASVLNEDDDSISVTARIGSGKDAQGAVMTFAKGDEGSLQEISIVTEAGARPVKPQELGEVYIATAQPVWYIGQDGYEELYLPMSEAFTFTPENAENISLVYTDLSELEAVGDVGDTDGDGTDYTNSYFLTDIYGDQIGLNEMISGTDKEVVDVELARVKPFIYTGDPAVPEVLYKGMPLTADYDYELTFYDEEGTALDEVKEPGTYQVYLLGKGDYWGDTLKDFKIIFSEEAALAMVEEAELECSTAEEAIRNAVESGDEEALKSASIELISARSALSDARAELDRTREVLSEEERAKLNDKITNLEDRVDTLEEQLKDAEIPDITNYQVTMKTSFTYTGKAIRPAIKVKGVPSSEYVVEYSANKKVGTAKVTIKANGKKYKGTIAKTFTILPKKAAVSKAAAGRKKLIVKAKVKPSKTGGSQYQVQYRIKGTSKWKTKTTKKQTLKISKLRSGRKYQVRIRAVRKVGKKTYAGKWSKVKTSAKIR